MIHVRFDLAVSVGNRDQDELLARVLVPQVPDVGERINVRGNPYVIVERGWAVESPPSAAIHATNKLFAFLRLVPAFKDQT